MMVREAPPICDEGVEGTQNCFQIDSCIAIALRSPQGNFAATCTVRIGLPQPWPSIGTDDGPAEPHVAGPAETIAKIDCHCATVGFVPFAALTAQLAAM